MPKSTARAVTRTPARPAKPYAGLKVDQARRLRDLEEEIARLKRVLSEAELDEGILKEAASGNL